MHPVPGECGRLKLPSQTYPHSRQHTPDACRCLAARTPRATLLLASLSCPLLPSSLLASPQGVEIGIGIGVGVSLVVVIYRTAFPRITTLGRLPGTSIYR